MIFLHVLIVFDIFQSSVHWDWTTTQSLLQHLAQNQFIEARVRQLLNTVDSLIEIVDRTNG